MKKTIEIGRDELLTTCYLCAIHAIRIMADIEPKDKGKEKEIKAYFEKEMNDIVDIAWNRDRTKDAPT